MIARLPHQIGILILWMLMLVLAVVACAVAATPTRVPSSSEATLTPASTPTAILAPTPTPTLTEIPFAELKDMASRVSYDELFRNNEQHVGELLYYEAEVVQVIEGGNDRYQLRANVTRGQYAWGDPVFLHYSGPRILEDDIIEFVGTVSGLVTYEAVLGNKVTIPEISIIQSRLIAKASEPTPTFLPSPTPPVLPTVRRTPTLAPPPTQTPTPIPTPKPISLTGAGQQASSKFMLNQGLSIFRLTHDGQSSFSIWLLDSGGDKVDLLVNEIGPFDGSKAVGIRKAGIYILDVSADGRWSVDIKQPAPLAEVDLPITFSGRGQQASQFLKLASGLTTFRMTHDGGSNFSIWLLDGRGDKVDLLVNDIGPFDGSKAVGIREAGTYILDISADGNWTVSVEQ